MSVDLELCKMLCSTISHQKFDKYIQHIKENNLKEAINIMYNINENGYSVIDILDYFFEYVKSTNKLSEDEKYQVIPLLCKYITTFYNVHENNIELVFFSNDILKLLYK